MLKFAQNCGFGHRKRTQWTHSDEIWRVSVDLGCDLAQGKASSLGNIFGFYKTRHILLSNSANCTVLLAVVVTQYRRVTDRRTDGWTDGITIANTALAMRALWRAVKSTVNEWFVQLVRLLGLGYMDALLSRKVRSVVGPIQEYISETVQDTR